MWNHDYFTSTLGGADTVMIVFRFQTVLFFIQAVLSRVHTILSVEQAVLTFIIINTVSVMFDNYDWHMMLKLLSVSSYRRRIKADKRLKGGAKTIYVIVGYKLE